MKKKKQKHILVVEDDDILAGLLSKRLRRAGFLVSNANNGKKGLEQIEKGKPDLVLLDILLPEMDGFDVLHALLERGLLPALPVIVISNSGQPIEIERLHTLGIRDYLVKVNFSPHEVLEKVEKVFATS